MKYFLLILLLLRIGTLQAQESIGLEGAMATGVLKASFEGNSKSLHYIKPLRGTLSNKTNQKIKIRIEAGTFFTNNTHQDILSNMPQTVDLQAGETKKIEIFGISTQRNALPPRNEAIYTPQKCPSKEYTAYAQFIAQEKLHSTAEAQYGLWILSEKEDIRKLMQRSLRENIALKIRDFLVQMLQITDNLDELPREVHHKVLIDSNLFVTYTLTSPAPAPECEVKGGGNFSLKSPKEVRLVLFDTKGVLVRELYYNPKEKIGSHSLRYGYDCNHYKEEAYLVGLVFDGKPHVSAILRRKKF